MLAGHLHGVVPTRVQIFGETEITYFETLTPAVVSRPQPASATANSATATEPLPSRNAQKTASAMRIAV